MDRFRARSLSGRTYLHLLGLFPSALAEEFGIAHRSSFAQRRTGATTSRRRRRSLGPRPAPRKRPRADLDRAGYGREGERSETVAQHGQAVQHSGQRLRLVAKAGKVTVANDRCQHGYAQRRAFILNKQRAGTVCPAYLLPYSRQNLSTSPNGFKICKVPIPWTFAFGLDSR